MDATAAELTYNSGRTRAGDRYDRPKHQNRKARNKSTSLLAKARGYTRDFPPPGTVSDRLSSAPSFALVS